MDWFCVPSEYFEPISENCIKPNQVGIHSYNTTTIYGTHYNCVDDGGLTEDKNPIGKTFRLVNDLGLEAIVKIKEDRRQTDRNGLDFDEIVYESDKGVYVVKAEFLADGFIEGYTSIERCDNTDIHIRLCDKGKRVYWLAYYESHADQVAYQQFPLWQEYFEILRKHAIEQRNHIQPLFDMVDKLI